MHDINQLADRVAIIELVSNYAHALDNYDADAWVNCFTEDAIHEVQAGDSTIRFAGRDMLKKFVDAHIQLLPGTRHLMTNHVVTIDGDYAKHKCTLTGTVARPDKVYLFVSGSYESDVVKVNGEWKIKHRLTHVDNPENFEQGELATHMQPIMEWVAVNGAFV